MDFFIFFIGMTAFLYLAFYIFVYKYLSKKLRTILEEEHYEIFKSKELSLDVEKLLKSINITSNSIQKNSVLMSIAKYMVINKFIIQNFDKIKRDFETKVRTDKYGIENDIAWKNTLKHIYNGILFLEFKQKLKEYNNKIINYFDQNSLQQNSQEKEFINNFDHYFRKIYFDINQINPHKKYKEYFESILENCIDGYDYEKTISEYINSALKIEGWSAFTTQGSGDQGVDVIAEHKNGDIVAIQCKFYSQSVSNKAVQEITAGKIFYKAHHAFVVTNSTYTKSAYALASETNVELLHHSMLLKSLQHIA